MSQEEDLTLGGYHTQQEVDEVIAFFATLTDEERQAAKVCRFLGMPPFMAMEFLIDQRRNK
jgi:hypothetical protein